MKLTRFLLPATLTCLLATSAGWTANLTARYQRQLQAQSATAARIEQQIQQLRGQRDALLSRLAAARQQPDPSAAAPAGPAAAPELAEATEVERWVRQTKRLKQAFERRPDQKIPELALMDDQDWLRTARSVQLDTEDDLDRAMAIMRNKAREDFTRDLQNALTAYVKANNGRLPADTEELEYYCAITGVPMHWTPNLAICAQYEMVGPGEARGGPPGTIMKLKSLVNEDYDDSLSFQRGAGDTFTHSTSHNQDPAKPRDEGSPDDQLNAQIEYDLGIAVRAFVAKNRGALPKNPAELLPYFDPPAGPALSEMLKTPLTPEQEKKFPADIAKLAAGRHLPR
jgi:hypothetical protein